MPLGKALYTGFTGLSPVMAEEICYTASLDSSLPANALSEMETVHLYHIFSQFMDDVKTGTFSPCIAYDGALPVEFSALPLSHLTSVRKKAVL